MEEFENIFVGIISFAGTARSCYIEAIQEAKKGDFDAASLIVIHAEDQMMSAETFGILAEEFIDLYKKYGN